ncbi:HD-GYP domain-containing protein [Clostridium mediterraneense]|uniref:HD-GYP domain-containing protein n=1 Tax=Clostridium mediterraneense TaxID=1805472 RepID=UPI000835B016|nr:HD-GYP domain-containing protein [Clostridium mediterraneense]
MRLVPIESIKINSVLARTIYDNDGRALLKEGVHLTESLLKKVKELKIYSLYIIDEYSDKEINDVISPELRQKSIRLVKDIFNYSDGIKLASSNVFDLDPKKRLSILKEKEAYIDTLKNLSEEICQSIINNKDISVSLVDIKNMDNYTYQHSVNVATLSVVIGVGLGLPKNKLVDLCIGALLHDIGKVFVGKKIIQKPGKLTDEEFEIIKTHPKKGYDYIKDNPGLKTSSKMVILQHHERVDGTGYPSNTKDDDINILAKIVAIADVYDALTSDRPYKRAMCPNDAFEFILSKVNSMFDIEIVKVFSRVVVPYPPGSIVKLSNSSLAVVENTNSVYPLRPKIRTIQNPDEKLNNITIDLAKELSLVISSIEYKA